MFEELKKSAEENRNGLIVAKLKRAIVEEAQKEINEHGYMPTWCEKIMMMIMKMEYEVILGADEEEEE